MFTFIEDKTRHQSLLCLLLWMLFFFKYTKSGKSSSCSLNNFLPQKFTWVVGNLGWCFTWFPKCFIIESHPEDTSLDHYFNSGCDHLCTLRRYWNPSIWVYGWKVAGFEARLTVGLPQSRTALAAQSCLHICRVVSIVLSSCEKDMNQFSFTRGGSCIHSTSEVRSMRGNERRRCMIMRCSDPLSDAMSTVGPLNELRIWSSEAQSLGVSVFFESPLLRPRFVYNVRQL